MARNKLKKHHVYKITWVDAFSENNWTHITELDKDLIDARQKPVECVGIYLKSAYGFYVFTTGYDQARENLFNYWSVPSAWVLEIKEIKA